jgi:hypothetical protein
MQAVPHARDAAVRAHIGGQVQRLLRLRNDWMEETGHRMTYEGSQVSLGRKEYDFELGRAIHDALGPLAMISDLKRAALYGELEYFHRYAILMAHPGGTVEIQKLRMFRGMEAERPA